MSTPSANESTGPAGEPVDSESHHLARRTKASAPATGAPLIDQRSLGERFRASVIWRRRFLIGSALAALVASVLYVQLIAASGRDEEARKDATALEIEAQSASYISNPRDASDFYRRLASDDLAMVGVSTLGERSSSATASVLYADRHGGHYFSRLVGCVFSCQDENMDLAKMSIKHGFKLSAVQVDPRSASQLTAGILGAIGTILLQLSPALLLMFFVVYQIRGTSKKASLVVEKPTIRFDDVIGAENAKKALRRVAAFMKDPKAYVEIGSTIPRGVMMAGPKGTGKTLLAKALAGECGCNFIAVDGSSFSAPLVGVGVSRVEKLFKQARAAAPCIVFIDEFDSVGRRVSGASGAAEQEQSRITGKFLTELDGFKKLEEIVVIGATNFLENIDDALLRPGRFDLIARTELPTLPERVALFDHYALRVRREGLIDSETLARMADRMSPADIANSVNIAAAYAAESGAKAVTFDHVVHAIETQQMGGEVSSTNDVITPETRRRICRHEAGHAYVAFLQGLVVSHISAQARDRSLGATYVQRGSEEPLYGEVELNTQIAIMLGGREAEMLFYGNASTGAGDDLKRASELAVKMVGNLGFGKTFGLLSLAGVPQELVGPDVQLSVLKEARELLDDAQARCKALLTAHTEHVDRLATALLLKGSISGEPLRQLLAGAPGSGDLPRLAAPAAA